MTEQQQSACAELARRMGITIEKRWQHVTDSSWCLYDLRLPGGTYLGAHCGSIEEAHALLPDYFTDHAASRELVAWLAADDEILSQYIKELWRLSAEQIDNWKGRPDLRVKILTTPPLPVIARAACKALGIAIEG